MTVVVATWVTVDFAALERLHAERLQLRKSYRCTNTRLLRHPSEPERALVLMEFPSMLDAKGYLSATMLSLGADGDKIRGKTALEYFEGFSLDAAAAAAIAAA